jgi:toxin ParE1/3/4
MTAVVYTEAARADLLDIWFYLAEESLSAADNTLDSLEKDVVLLSTQPLAGRERPELGAGVRSWPSSTPYILFYAVDNSRLIVIRVLHHARDIHDVDMLN